MDLQFASGVLVIALTVLVMIKPLFIDLQDGNAAQPDDNNDSDMTDQAATNRLDDQDNDAQVLAEIEDLEIALPRPRTQWDNHV